MSEHKSYVEFLHTSAILWLWNWKQLHWLASIQAVLYENIRMLIKRCTLSLFISNHIHFKYKC